jgi:uncharacterized iron-regulated protein
MLAVWGSSAAAEAPASWPQAWRSPLASAHPLVGRIWSAREMRFVTPERFEQALAAAPLVLLGEVHDNVDHHRVQAWAIGVIAARRGPAAVFEQIRTDQRPALDRFAEATARAPPQPTANRLFELLEWDKSGWPPAEIYAPLFEAAIRSKTAIVPGHPPREQVRAVAKSGSGVLEAAEHSRLALDRPLPAEQLDGLLAELESSHCGLMPKSALAGMAEAQRYRDAHLARALADAADRYGRAVLAAGNGHVRKDRGVPWHLQRMAPGKSLVSVMLAEVEAGKNDATDYAEARAGAEAVVDYMVFTPPAERTDPCERMREQAGRKG